MYSVESQYKVFPELYHFGQVLTSLNIPPTAYMTDFKGTS